MKASNSRDYNTFPRLTLDKKNTRLINKAFKKASHMPVVGEIEASFNNADVRVIKDVIHTKEVSKDEVILICLTKDSANLLPLFLDHHRKIGIKHFVFIDNNSTDNTVDYLLSQDDCSLFFIDAKYESGVPSLGWINQVLTHYGYNRWYLVMDTDELFVYDGIETYGINAMVEYCKKHKIKRVRSIMLDVYAKKPILSVGDSAMRTPESIKRTFNLIDSDTYMRNEQSGMAYGPNISGGPRERVFGKYGSVPALQKYPLFYYTKKDLRMSNHYLFPFKDNDKSPLISALLHYKFLPGDLKKYKEHIKTKTHYNGSAEYKAYVKQLTKHPKTTMFYEGSVEYVDSRSLKQLPVMETMDGLENVT